ncbi:hypothetical protein ACGF0J_10545 [Nonomuraea sp. NPDC047897]|uniref:hypothetical protein n=1 Tax=Nonomuraea sp. NPDC047897 TaxID=3364346 RepID=UPI00371B3B1D
MFKRRIAVLGAVGVLVLTGLAGSALADETPAPADSKIVCKTSDGKVIEFSGRVGAIKGPDGETLVAWAEPLADGDVVRASELERGVAHAVKASDIGVPEQAGRAVPAEPAVGPDGKPLPAVGPDGKPRVAGADPDGRPLPVPQGAETITCSAE